MLVAAMLASEWVASSFEQRLERWIVDSAHVGQTWLQAYQNDAVILGKVLADDPQFRGRLELGDTTAIGQQIKRVAEDLGINFLQIYSADRRLVYSSVPMKLKANWETGQTEAVLKVLDKRRNLLAAAGITPVPRSGRARYYLVLGGLLEDNFIGELNQLTGLKARLYYREGHEYYDVFSVPGKVQTLKHLPKEALRQLQQDKKPWYSRDAEGGRFRGQYTPIIDTSGRVEAILFSGLERRGLQEVLASQIALFAGLSLLGVAIGVLTALLLSRLLLRPIGHLRRGVMQLAGQNYHTSVPIDSDDELGDLAKAFNAMAVRLREARDEQQQRFQHDKLAALGELSAALAHEIRNPIGVIHTAAALLEKSPDDIAKRTELLRMLREESLRVSALVQDFLHLSRQRPPELAQIDPIAPLERALSACLAGIEHVTVTRHYQHASAVIRADAGLLQQAWTNILNNALQAMGPSGGQLKLESTVESDRVLVTVEDSGPGVPAEAVPRLFEPFFTTKVGGTGLGLAIAHTLIAANGGELSLVAAHAPGACFAMQFPIYDGAGVSLPLDRAAVSQ